jgi:bifunctional N-acetylglucosamine-1-phosphate-uridyltransferase/glucosamine-1-phosphate-acetyltransferase GlmU-like protein
MVRSRPSKTGVWSAPSSKGGFHRLGSDHSLQRVVGENAIVGAGSTVTIDVPTKAILAGNTARLLRTEQRVAFLTMS